MSDFTDPNYLRREHYRDSRNLDARARLHAQFSTNSCGWHQWVFDRLTFGGDSEILEVGCGPAYLWCENLARIPHGWSLTLTDFSTGMVRRATKNLGSGASRFEFAVADGRALPYSAASFDGLIANHMLYHLPDPQLALREIRRVLRPGGLLYASTVGRNHLREIHELVRRVDRTLAPGAPHPTRGFDLDNGEGQLSRFFAEVALRRYEDELLITDSVPLLEYVASDFAISQIVLEGRQQLRAYVEQEISRRGCYRVSKDVGMFEARLGNG